MQPPFLRRTLRPLRDILLGDRDLSPSASERFEREDSRTNAGRILAVSPLLLVLHLIHVAVMATDPAAGTSRDEVRWRELIAASHGVMAALAVFFLGMAFWLRRHPDAPNGPRHRLTLNIAFVIAYLAFSATVAGIDQLVTPNITPYLVAILGTAVLLPLPAVPLTISLLVAFAVFAFAVGAFAPPGPAAISNLLNGLTVTMTGWAIGRALRTARARNTEQAMTIEDQRSALEKLNVDLQLLADLDGLTGLPNRRSLLERGEQMRAHAARHDETLALLLVDVDHFKRVNDELGHARGDDVLLAVVGACKSQLRAEDLLGRLGGEEFTALLPQCTPDGAAQVADRMRAKVEGLAVPHPDGALVTVSVGVGLVDPTEPGAIDAALARADVSLYEAKRSGRNRVGPIAAS